MLFQDSGIFSPKIDSSQNLVFTIKVKKEDYTEAMQQFIFDTYNNGSTLDLQVVGLEERDTEIPKLRQSLALTMESYAKKMNKPLKSIINDVYTQNKVTSREDMTREQLESAIQKYKAGLLYD